MLRASRQPGSSERALDALYRHHAQDVFRYAMALLDRRPDAEDATQVTFMNAYKALERGERPRDAGKWLRAITLNVCREHYRRAGRRASEVPLEEDPAELVVEPALPEMSDIVRALSQLPFNQRAALVMREFEGRSMSEIATALEVSSSAVEALLFRARRGLREQLDGALTCTEAELALSRQLDGVLPRAERGQLRAHLRACPECAALARRLRGQRRAIRGLALLPVPASIRLGKLFAGSSAAGSAATGGSVLAPAGGGSLLSALGGSIGAKIVVAAAAGAAAVGAGYVALPHRDHARAPRDAALVSGHARPAGPPERVVGRSAGHERARSGITAASQPGRNAGRGVGRSAHDAVSVSAGLSRGAKRSHDPSGHARTGGHQGASGAHSHGQSLASHGKSSGSSSSSSTAGHGAAGYGHSNASSSPHPSAKSHSTSTPSASRTHTKPIKQPKLVAAPKLAPPGQLKKNSR